MTAGKYRSSFSFDNTHATTTTMDRKTLYRGNRYRIDCTFRYTQENIHDDRITYVLFVVNLKKMECGICVDNVDFGHTCIMHKTRFRCDLNL